MSNHCTILSCILVGLGVSLAVGPASAADTPGTASTPTVVFVCKYGSVKSLVATERFNRLAEQRGLTVRAISRAANTEVKHDKVPEKVLYELSLEGYNVANIPDPSVITPAEAAKALRVVHISLTTSDTEADPMSRAATELARDRIEHWDNIPRMFNDWHKARGLMLPRVDAMIDEFAKNPQFAKKQAESVASK